MPKYRVYDRMPMRLLREGLDVVKLCESTKRA